MDDQINRLLKNYLNARKSWEAWCFMANFNLDPPQFDTQRYIKNNQLLSHLRYLALKDFYIEFYKIVKKSKNNPDNIFTLLELFAEQNSDKIDEVDLNLKQLNEQGKSIIDLCNLRDKFYAHLDKDYEKYMYTGPTLPDILNCFIAVEQGIITLTSLEIIQKHLNELPSRYDFKL